MKLHWSQNPVIREWKYDGGLKRGLDPYYRYARLFGIENKDFSEEWICDYGCGPFGGMTAILDAKRYFPVDRLYKLYNRWGYNKHPILGMRHGIPHESIDTAFCLHVFDHTYAQATIAANLCRILRRGGRLFVFTHAPHPHRHDAVHWRQGRLRLYEWLGHPTRDYLFWRDKPFRWSWIKSGPDPIHDPDCWAVWGELIKK